MNAWVNEWMNEFLSDWVWIVWRLNTWLSNSVSGEGVCRVEWASLLLSLNQNSSSLNSPLPILVSHPPWALVGCQVIWCCWGVNGDFGSLGPLPAEGFAFSICLCFKHCCGNSCRLDNYKKWGENHRNLGLCIQIVLQVSLSLTTPVHDNQDM